MCQLGDNLACDSSDDFAEHNGRVFRQTQAFFGGARIDFTPASRGLVLPQLYLFAEAVCEVRSSIIGVASGGIVTLPAMISCGVTLRP
jgi:hypothetical protein